MSEEPFKKKAKEDNERLIEVVDRAQRGEDVSSLLVSANGHHVEPKTPGPQEGRRSSMPPPALHLACHCGDLSAVSALLRASPEAASGVAMPGGPRNWLPVIYAVHMGHLDLVKLLRDNGSPMPPAKLVGRAIKGGQLEMLAWLLSPSGAGFDMNALPKCLKRAVTSHVPRTLQTVLGVCKLNPQSLSSALEWAVEVGSVLRINHLLDAGADPSNGNAFRAAVEADNTLLVHRMLAHGLDASRCGSELVIAARHCNPEIIRGLVKKGAVAPHGIFSIVCAQGSRSDQDAVRSCMMLKKAGCVTEGDEEKFAAVIAATHLLREESKSWSLVPTKGAVALGRLVGKEKDFVKDKPVEQPKSFEVVLYRGAEVSIGRADAEQTPTIDLSNITAAQTVSRSHCLLRYRDGLERFEILILGRNGIYDGNLRFFPPCNDEWIPLDFFVNKTFEVGWVSFSIQSGP